MGHLGHLKEEYRALVARLDQGTVAMPEPSSEKAWAGWKEILEILYTPEEAALAARMPHKPTSLRRLAERLGVAETELAPRLDAMCVKGLVMDLAHPETGKVSYLLSPPVVGFFEYSMMRAVDGIPKKRMAEALEAYGHGDEAFAREVFGKDTVIGRAVVHETALNGDGADVLDWERATSLIRGARKLAVSLCYCRHKAEHLGQKCDAPMENCLSMNAGAEFVVRRNFGRPIEASEALEVLERSREQGLVQIADNVQNRPTYVCNCCGCCCGQLAAINDYDLRAVNPSGFLPAVDDAKCKGCSRCSRACPITALDMVGARQVGKRKNELRPKVNEDRCIGCGVCADTCRSDAMTMKRSERPDVPSSSVEKAVLQAVERGRLAHMVFDQESNPVLNRVLAAVLRLPPAERALASQQLRSRFVKATLKRMKVEKQTGL